MEKERTQSERKARSRRNTTQGGQDYFLRKERSNQDTKIVVNTERRPMHSIIPRGLVCSDSLITNLVWTHTSVLRFQGQPVVVRNWNPTSIYNVVEGSNTVVPGAKQWAAFYKRYRVLSYRVELEASSNHPSTVHMLHGGIMEKVAENITPKEFGSYNRFQGIGEVRDSRRKSSSHPWRFSRYVNCREMIGFRDREDSERYAAQVGETPERSIYYVLLAHQGVLIPEEEIMCRVKCYVRVQFFGRRYFPASINEETLVSAEQ